MISLATCRTLWPLRHAVTSLLALGCLLDASAASGAPTPWRTDCVGYHTLQVPGEVEYAVLQRRPQLPLPFVAFSYPWGPAFADGLYAWGNDWHVATSLGAEEDASAIRLTAMATSDDLQVLMDAKNKEQRKKRDDFLDAAASAERVNSPGSRDISLGNANKVGLYQPLHSPPAFYMAVSVPTNPNQPSLKRADLVEIHTLIGNRIVSATRKPEGSPQQTVDAFLSHYKPREPFEVPKGPGVCLPYATMTGEATPASVGMSLRLKDRPDIVVFLRDWPVGSGEDYAPGEVLAKEIRIHTPGARDTVASDKLRPIRSTTLAGQKGVGAFITIYRPQDRGGDAASAALAKPETDWGYVAFAPGDKDAAAGTSSYLMLKVLRYGRYATQPMSEREFRKLAESIAASIQRRSGAWVAR